VTVIATTNRDLSEAVEKGEFRMDLYYRLNPFALVVPPLRERREDIPVLAEHFLAFFSKEYNKTIEGFSEEAKNLLFSYKWPGNVRELQNVIRGIVVLQNTNLIMPEHLPAEVSGLTVRREKGPQDRFILPEEGISLDAFEKDLIVQALEKAGRNKTKAAKLLNISYDSFRYQLKKFSLE
jgi:transcriptional regulator with PAS, ATPase and Fis domain